MAILTPLTIVFVSGHARDDGPCCFLDLVIALPREFQKNTDVFCSHDVSSFYLTVDVLEVFLDEAKLLRQKRMLLCDELLRVCDELLLVDLKNARSALSQN